MPTKQKTSLAARESKKVEQPQEEDSYILVVSDGEREYRLDPDELGPADDLACRQQTGISVDDFIARPSSVGIIVIIWIARRRGGEPNLAYKKVEDKYPTYKSMAKLTFKVVDRSGNEVDVEDEAPLVEGQ